jgi:hypothetical protein
MCQYANVQRVPHQKDNTVRGVVQLNEAIEWLRRNQNHLPDGVVYFADDDNRYDVRLFEEVFETNTSGCSKQENAKLCFMIIF